MSKKSQKSNRKPKLYICKKCEYKFNCPDFKKWKILGEAHYFCTKCSMNIKNLQEPNLNDKFLIELTGHSKVFLKQIKKNIIPDAKLIKGFLKVDPADHDLDVFQMYVEFRRKVHWDQIYYVLCDNGHHILPVENPPRKLINLRFNKENFDMFQKNMKKASKTEKFLYDKHSTIASQKKRTKARLAFCRKNLNIQSTVDMKLPEGQHEIQNVVDS